MRYLYLHEYESPHNPCHHRKILTHLDRLRSSVIRAQATQVPVVLDSLDQRVVGVRRSISVILSLALDRVANQSSVDVVRRAVGLALVVGHDHGEILCELGVLEAWDPLALEIGGDVRGIGVVAVVVEVGDVVPPLRKGAGLEVLFEVGAGHDVGAALGVASHGLGVNGWDVLGSVRVRDAVGGCSAASAGVVFGVHLPGDSALLEEVEDGGVGEGVDGWAGVVGYAEGGAGDGGDVIWEGGVGDTEVLAEQTVVFVCLDLFEGWVCFGGGVVGVFEYEETPLLEVLARAGGLRLLQWGGQDRADERKECERVHSDGQLKRARNGILLRVAVRVVAENSRTEKSRKLPIYIKESLTRLHRMILKDIQAAIWSLGTWRDPLADHNGDTNQTTQVVSALTIILAKCSLMGQLARFTQPKARR